MVDWKLGHGRKTTLNRIVMPLSAASALAQRAPIFALKANSARCRATASASRAPPWSSPAPSLFSGVDRTLPSLPGDGASSVAIAYRVSITTSVRRSSAMGPAQLSGVDFGFPEVRSVRRQERAVRDGPCSTSVTFRVHFCVSFGSSLSLDAATPMVPVTRRFHNAIDRVGGSFSRFVLCVGGFVFSGWC